MPHEIADNLRRLMVERDIDANTLASQLGYRNRATIDHWLSGRRLPTPENIQRAAEVLGVPAEVIDPSGSAYSLKAPRRKSGPVDKSDEVGDNPYSFPTVDLEGPMKDHIEAVVHALQLLDEEKRPAFVAKMKRIAASMLLGIDLEDAGAMPAKRKRASGED